MALTAWQKWLDRAFGIDLRALATFRIGVGLLLLYDLIDRARFLEAHYTDFGALPRVDLVGNLWHPAYWSLHVLSGDSVWQAVLFVLAGVAAIVLTIGWHTRIAGWVSWLLLLSLHARNPILLQGGDVLLRVLMFWALWLPWGAVASLDARRVPQRAPQRVVSVASFALLWQLALMYIFSGFMKSGPAWVSEGSAVFYALSIDAMRTAWGERLLAHRDWCQAMTFAALYLERFGPLLAFVPWRTNLWRWVTVIAFWGLHLGLIATMRIGHFPYLCILAWVLYLPSSCWDVLSRIAVGWNRHGQVPCTSDERPPVDNRLGWTNRVLNHALVWLFVLVGIWNVRIVWPGLKSLERLKPLDPVLIVPRLDQSWGMFAPYTLTEDGWWVMVGTLDDGRQVNLWNPAEPVSDDKPDLRAAYVDERWRKYFMNLWQLEFSAAREPFSEWLVRRWNRDQAAAAGSECHHVEMYFWIERTALGEPDPWEKLLVLKQDVPEKPIPASSPD
ncbi:MAG: HTTM domain-containing protein [Planctomycetaceae bacterium]|nr:HTTM domain-containing protein [Planctomycetaceae bacterium]